MENKSDDLKWWETILITLLLFFAIAGFLWTCNITIKHFTQISKEKKEKELELELRISNVERNLDFIYQEFLLTKLHTKTNP